MVIFKNWLKQLKIAVKMKIYRICIIILLLLMAIIACAAILLINTKVKEITSIWSPSLAYIQEADTLTSDYRLMQYQHLVSSDKKKMEEYEKNLDEIKQEIENVLAKFEVLIKTEQGRNDYNEIMAQWKKYEGGSEKIINLSSEGKQTEAAELMLGDVYSSYTTFCEKFSELNTYSQNQLEKAKQIASTTIIMALVSIALITTIIIIVTTIIGKMVSRMIAEPIEQIETAIGNLRIGELSNTDMLTYESEDELGVAIRKLREAMNILSAYISEISGEVKSIAIGDLTKDANEITDFLGDFVELKESLTYILKRFNSTLTEIQYTSEQVESDAKEVESASQSLADGATEQAGVIEELNASIDTVVSLADDTAKETQQASEQVRSAVQRANAEKQKMHDLTAEMEYIIEISKEIENIITDIEDIATQTNLLSLNASIEAARAGEAGRGFAVVADQIGKLATDSAKSAVNTRNLINKTLVEIEKGNDITVSTAEAFNQIISDMEMFAEVAQRTTEKANTQADSLEEIGQGIEQLSGVVQSTAASSEENTAISINLSDKSKQLNELVTRFKLF